MKKSLKEVGWTLLLKIRIMPAALGIIKFLAGATQA